MTGPSPDYRILAHRYYSLYSSEVAHRPTVGIVADGNVSCGSCIVLCFELSEEHIIKRNRLHML